MLRYDENLLECERSSVVELHLAKVVVEARLRRVKFELARRRRVTSHVKV